MAVRVQLGARRVNFAHQACFVLGTAHCAGYYVYTVHCTLSVCALHTLASRHVFSSVCSIQLSLRVHRYPLAAGCALLRIYSPHVELRVSALYVYRV